MTFVAQFLGRRLEYTYEFVELVPDVQLVMRTAEGPFPMETTYTWTAASPTANAHDPAQPRRARRFSKAMAPLMAPAMRRANRKDLAKLKSILEGREG